MFKERISKFLQHLMKELGETQDGLATRLGIKKSSLQGYLKGTNLASVDVLMKMAELGGVKLDDLLKAETMPKPTIPETRPTLTQTIVSGNHNVLAQRDVYQNVTRKITNKYSPGPDDITGDQPHRLKDLVNLIVELEVKVKLKPKTYGAVWNALNRKMGVTYYREIKQWQFEAAEGYLSQWIGRLKRPLQKTDNEKWRKDRYKAIFMASKNQMGWTKESVDALILEKFKKDSIRFLDATELEKLYGMIMNMKRKK